MMSVSMNWTMVLFFLKQNEEDREKKKRKKFLSQKLEKKSYEI